MHAKKPLTRDEERNLITFLATSDEVASLAATRLKSRAEQRNVVLADLKKAIPAADEACKKASARLSQCTSVMEKARGALSAAEADYHQAYVISSSAHSTRTGLISAAHRQAAALADPRIYDLSCWVQSLIGPLRSVDLSQVVRELDQDGGWVRRAFAQNGKDPSSVASAISNLEKIVDQLHLKLVEPYGEELIPYLESLKEEAIELVRGLLPAWKFDLLVERSPDLVRLTLPTS